MSKFCENCGAEMDDNQVVCPNCGNGATEEVKATVEEKVNEVKETVSEKASEAKSALKSNNVKNIAIIAGIVAVAAIILAIIISIVSGGWKKPIDNYFKGMEKGKADIYLKAYPPFMEMDKTVDDDYMEDMKDSLEDEYGEKIKISYKVTKKEKIKKEKLEDIKEYIEKRYDEDVKVSAGYEVKVKATIKGKKDEDTDTQKMYVYKIDGKWYYMSTSPDSAKSYLKSNK